MQEESNIQWLCYHWEDGGEQCEPVSGHTASEITERTGNTGGDRETSAPEEAPQVQKRPTQHSPEQTKFFDFADEKEKDTSFKNCGRGTPPRG